MSEGTDLEAKLAAAEQWVRDEFAWLEAVAADLGTEPGEEKGPGRFFRVRGEKVLRIHPKTKHIGLGFPDALRADVQSLTGSLRSQQGHAWVNYQPASLDRETVELLFDLAVTQPAAGAPAARPAPGEARSAAARGGEVAAATCREAEAPAVAPDPRAVRDDSADLELILSLLRAFERHQHKTGIASSIRVLREALYFHWEGPRLPAGRKYAPSLLHSPAARAQRDTGNKTGLVYEHAVPVNLVLRALLAEVPTDGDALRQRLDAHSQRVIITKAEDAKLTASGFRSHMPDPDDVWSRYRAVGIDPDQFLPWRQADA